MVVKIVPKFTKADIRKIMEEKAERINKAILLLLQRIGEAFVKNARSINTYKDQTGNLRNSIGYLIMRDGQQLVDNFRKSATILSKKGSKDGLKEGKELAIAISEELSSKYPKGYILIVVAGMDYAAAVESKGYDVLTSSGKKAETDLKAAIVKLGDKLKRA